MMVIDILIGVGLVFWTFIVSYISFKAGMKFK